MKRKVITGHGHYHFVTFSTYGRRKLLRPAFARQIVISRMQRLVKMDRVNVAGFVIMLDHVHAILWHDDDTTIPGTVGVWKSTSAKHLKKLYGEKYPSILDQLKTSRSGRERTCFWQRKYYDFNLNNDKKLNEKLEYMHYNPVKVGLCAKPEEWRWSSYLFYMKGRSVGVDIRS